VLEHIGDRTTKQWSVLAAGNSTERTVDDGIGSKLRFTSLPGVRAELSRVRQSVGAGPAPILDNEFTLTTLKDGLAKQPSVVHLASHFQFDPRAESLSFLLTGQGEVLRASDTTVLTKDAFKGVDLLTLSACQTGTFSETADGMEVEGIASLMQRKGAGAVMSTLWPVADASTAAFMGTFYTLRAQDPRRTKAWCMREAQLRMIRGEVAPPGAPKPVATRGTTSIKVSAKGLRKDWSHPYHWAPFILQGNPL
jgi:CHAT domain-containing protein